MGLLDVLNTDQGRMGLGLLAAAGPRSDGAGFGQRLAEGMGSFDAYKANALKQKMLEAQMQEHLQAQQQAQAMRALAAKFAIPASPAVPQGADIPSGNSMGNPNAFSTSPSNAVMPGKAAQQAIPAGFDREGFGRAYEAMNPIAGHAYLQSIQKDNSPITVAPGASLVDRNTFKPIYTAPKEHNLPAEQQGYELARSQGYTGSFMDYQTALKKAGATNISTKVEAKMGDSLASQVGPMVKDTYTAAQGAVQQIDAANRIIDAVDSGKIIAGPLAGGRLKVAQIGQILGVTGKDDAETIARSRDVIRGLSEMTLQGRKQMTGQGAITQSEGKLAEKANSGSIEDLTPAEIKQLANASARASRFVYQQHEYNLQNLNSSPDTAKLGKFYKVRPLPAFNFGDPPASSGGGKVVDFGALK